MVLSYRLLHTIKGFVLIMYIQEGPMIHSGAVVAAGVSQGRSTTFKTDCKVKLNFDLGSLKMGGKCVWILQAEHRKNTSDNINDYIHVYLINDLHCRCQRKKLVKD